jgi:dihydroorotase
MSKLVIFGEKVVASPTEAYSNVFIEIHQGQIYRLTHFGHDPDISADVIMPGFIDPHVHCRDWRQLGKETIKTAARAAAHGGVTQIHDMPNTSPPILSKDGVEKRLETAEKSGLQVKYMMYPGLTSRRSQIRDVVEAVEKYPQVAGLKLYAGESVGELAVPEPGKQLKVYRALADLNYTGVLMVHCEKETEFSKEIWSVRNPETWCDIRPPRAEIESVQDQIKFAVKAGFKGNLHVCHVTMPESVDLLLNSPKTLKVSCGVTPHHVLLASEMMQKKSRGLYYKVNPPLRSRETVFRLVRLLLASKVDWIESDHAPHTLKEKLNAPFASGVPGLDTYSNFIAALNRHFNLPFEDIVKLTSLNAVKSFGLAKRGISPGNEASLTLLDMKPEMIKREKMRTRCGWSPYEDMTFPGRCKATIVDGEVAYLEKG